ncbi:MAG: DUF45 domain-containing protein [Clostridia bacterium]|nr:DUF45 domain-containing protein [Clostridia bacterium]
MRYKAYEIKVTVRKNCRNLVLRCRDGDLMLSVPPGVPSERIEAFLASEEGWMRSALIRNPAPGQMGDPAELKALVARYLPVWQERMGVEASALRYRRMVSKWGSCNCRTGVITLNMRLAGQEDALVEYVLVHELCHLLQPNHSPAFYEVLSAMMPDWPARRRRLNGKA